MGRDFALRAIVAAALSGLMACEQPTPPPVGQDSTVTPPVTSGGPVELTFSGAPATISFPGSGRANVNVIRNGATVQDGITLEVATTGPFTASWESQRWELRTLRITAADTGSGTVTVTVSGKSASFNVRAEAVTFKEVAMTSWGVAGPSAPSPNGCGIAADDHVWCWGGNGSRQLGTTTPRYCSGGACQYGAAYDSPSPVPVATSQTFSQVVTTSYDCGQFIPDTCGRSCALTAAGEAWCWGDGFTSPVRVAPTMTFRSIVVGGAAGMADRSGSCGITRDDKAYCFAPSSVIAVADGMAVRSIAPNRSHMCVAAVAGDIWCWGTNYYGMLGIGNVDGQKYAAPQRATTTGGFVAVEASYDGTCALDAGGAIHCWGGFAYTGDGDSPPPSCGGLNSAFLCQPTPRPAFAGRKYTAIAAPKTGKGICGLTSDGEVDCWEYFNMPPHKIVSPEPFVSMTHGCGKSATGVQYCWPGTSGAATKFR